MSISLPFFIQSNTNSPTPTTSSMQQALSNTHSFSCSHHCRINTAENYLDLKSSNCPGSLALKQSQPSKKNILETRTAVTELLQDMFYCELRRLQAWPMFFILVWRTTTAVITNETIFHIVTLVIAVMVVFTDVYMVRKLEHGKNVFKWTEITTLLLDDVLNIINMTAMILLVI